MNKKLEEYTKDELIRIIRNLKVAKKFGLVWEDKPELVVEQCQTQLPVLLEVKEHSIITENGVNNLIIEGDNYHALSVLNYTHTGKIDVIYIDPPYNTGKEDFIYNDNFVDKEDSFRHSKWISFMYKRLDLSKSLLAKDGSLFISIDDNEYPRLIMMLEEIFGEKSIKTIAVKMSEATGVKMASVIKSGRIPKLKEYLVIVKPSGIKSLHLDKLPKGSWDEEYKTLITNATVEQTSFLKEVRDNEDRETKDIERCNEILAGWETTSLSDYYKINNLTKTKQVGFKVDNAWRIVQIATLTGGGRDLAIAKKRSFRKVPSFFCITTPQKKLYIIKGSFNQEARLPRCKLLFADDYLTVHPGDFWSDIKTTGLDNEGGVAFKNGKKPLKLIERIIKTNHKNDITVLDYFAGSGTTGEAVMRLNEADDGHRKFILCTTGIEKEIDGVNIATDITLRRVQGVKSTKKIVRYFKTAFVAKAKTDDQTRLALIERCTDMIRVREDAYDYLIDDEKLKLLSSGDHNAAIIFDPLKIEDFFKRIEATDHKKPLNAYIFSYSSYTYDEDIPDTKLQYTLCAIPESVLEVYRRIFREDDSV